MLHSFSVKRVRLKKNMLQKIILKSGCNILSLIPMVNYDKCLNPRNAALLVKRCDGGLVPNSRSRAKVLQELKNIHLLVYLIPLFSDYP